MACFSAPRRSRTPQTFRQVTVVWKHLTHPNIVPLLGVTLYPPQLISDRMPGGDLTEYIASHPDADRPSLVSDLPASLYEILTPSSAVWCRRGSQTPAFARHNSRRTQRGTWLFFVSFNHFIDLRQSNILVDASGNARITDFGLVMVTQDLDSLRGGSDECRDGARWIAPEILESRGAYSKEADVFSFAMVVIEVRRILST